MREHSGLADGVQTTANFGDMGEITSFGTDTFTTDHFGNMKTQMVGLNTTTFNWDFESHLTGIDYPGTSNDDSHECDGNGLRMRSKLSGAADWTNLVTDEVTGNLIAEYTLISGTFTLKSVNGWGAGLLWTNREGTKRYFHFDGDGSTWALTDASQNVTDTYEYTSFGVAIASTGSSVNPFRWMGQYGAYDDGARGSAQGWLLWRSKVFAPTLALGTQGAGTAGRNDAIWCSWAWNCPRRVPGGIGRWWDAWIGGGGKFHWCRACAAACISTCCSDDDELWAMNRCIRNCTVREYNCRKLDWEF